MKDKDKAQTAPSAVLTIQQAMALPEGLYKPRQKNVSGMRVTLPCKLEIIIQVPPSGTITEFIDKDGKRKQIVLTSDGYRKVSKC